MLCMRLMQNNFDTEMLETTAPPLLLKVMLMFARNHIGAYIYIYIYSCIGKYAIEEENATNEDWGEIDSENGLCMILRSLLFV